MISQQRQGLSADQQPTIHLVAVCLDCRRRHEIYTSPLQWLTEMENWRQKHVGHIIEFHSPKRRIPRRFPKWIERFWSDWNRGPWWVDFSSNTDIKLAYAASAAYTITLGALGTSSTLVAGRESNAVSNTSNLYLDYAVAGHIPVGTTPTTATVIEVWAYAGENDSVNYPDVFDGTDSAETVTSAAIKQAALRNIAFLGVDSNTTGRIYAFAATSLAAAFNGIIPKNHGLFVTHNTGVNLNATDGNHVLSYTGIYITG